MVIEKQSLSLADLLALGEDAHIEIVNWELVEMPPAGGKHQLIAMNIIRILDAYVQAQGIGVVMPDQMTYLMNSPMSGLKDSFVPDVSYFSHDNVPENWDIEKPHPGAPDLAVEIISPNDNAEIVKTKVKTYLEQGTIQVWLVYPKLERIEQFTSANPQLTRNYEGASSINADDMFPDIEGLTTSAIFNMPSWAIKEGNSD